MKKVFLVIFIVLLVLAGASYAYIRFYGGLKVNLEVVNPKDHYSVGDKITVKFSATNYSFSPYDAHERYCAIYSEGVVPPLTVPKSRDKYKAVDTNKRIFMAAILSGDGGQVTSDPADPLRTLLKPFETQTFTKKILLVGDFGKYDDELVVKGGENNVSMYWQSAKSNPIVINVDQAGVLNEGELAKGIFIIYPENSNVKPLEKFVTDNRGKLVDRRPGEKNWGTRGGEDYVAYFPNLPTDQITEMQDVLSEKFPEIMFSHDLSLYTAGYAGDADCLFANKL